MTTPADRRVCLVTGASSGNGRAIALRLANGGAAVVCCDLAPTSHAPSFDGARPTHELIEDTGGSAIFVRADVRDGEHVRAAFGQGLRAFGRLDVVVANAGISPQPPVHLPEEEYDTFRAVTAVNQEGTWWTAREGSRILREQGSGGRIVLLSSIAGLVGSDSGVHYCMSKAAVIGLTRALAAQMAPHDITVNAVAPGFVRTAMTAAYLSDPARAADVARSHPLGRIGEPADVAAAVNFLASPEAGWLTGVVLPVDGGYSAI